LSGGINILLGILGLEIVLLLVTSFVPIFGAETSATVAVLFIFVGMGLFVVSHIWLLLRIWGESPSWAIGAFFFPIVCLIAVAKFPEQTKRSFVGQFICVAIALCTLPVLVEQLSKPREYNDTKRHVKLVYPGEWNARESDKIDALIIESPTSESQWGALVTVQAAYGSDAEEFREKSIEDYMERLRKTKTNFALQSSKAVVHPSGISTIELVYTYVGQEKIPITKKDIILAPPNSKIVLAINAAAHSSEWQKFEPKLDSVIDSVRPY
jgi:hypothetical protein